MPTSTDPIEDPTDGNPMTLQVGCAGALVLLTIKNSFHAPRGTVRLG